MKKIIEVEVMVVCIFVCFIFTACSGSGGGNKKTNQKCADFVSAEEFMACDRISQVIDKNNFVINEGKVPPEINGYYSLDDKEFYIDNWIAMLRALGEEVDFSSNTFSTGSGNLFTVYVETSLGSDYFIYFLSGEILDNEDLDIELLKISKNDYQAVLIKAEFISVEEINDADFDGISDEIDNCVETPNPSQIDVDKDGIGDACDSLVDSDNDGVSNNTDNCPNTSNPDQLDSDNDGIGDACEEDSDGDDVINDIDNCPNTSNPDQLDSDNDGIGDACEEDSDNDGVLDDIDGCPDDPGKTKPGTCGCGVLDSDWDGDGYLVCIDNCPDIYNPRQLDSDNNGVGDGCDDIDGDNVLDWTDNCLYDPNPDQLDLDKDGIGDVCDSLVDSDNDGVSNNTDNCPNISNPDQLDLDKDGIGDVCDPLVDSDNDGVSNNTDNCPNISNPDQLDSDNDGIGDACDLINDDGSSMENARRVTTMNESFEGLHRKEAWYSFEAIKDHFYFIITFKAGLAHEITIMSSSGKYLAFNPGRDDSGWNANIDNWKCQESGTYYLFIKNFDEEDRRVDIRISEFDDWVCQEPDCILNPGKDLPKYRENLDIYEQDDLAILGSSIAIGDIQYRTTDTFFTYSYYDFDWVYVHLEIGKKYEFRIIDIENTDMNFYLYGRDGQTILSKVNVNSESVFWTSDRTDWCLMRLTSWKNSIVGKYSLQVKEVE